MAAGTGSLKTNGSRDLLRIAAIMAEAAIELCFCLPEMLSSMRGMIEGKMTLAVVGPCGPIGMVVGEAAKPAFMTSLALVCGHRREVVHAAVVFAVAGRTGYIVHCDGRPWQY